MKHTSFFLAFVLSFGSAGCAQTLQTPVLTALVNPVTTSAVDYGRAGAFSVSTHYETWTDAARGRDIKVKLYAPDNPTPPPVVIFSHGLGGSVEAASYLGERLASWGILSVHIQHPG